MVSHRLLLTEKISLDSVNERRDVDAIGGDSKDVSDCEAQIVEGKEELAAILNRNMPHAILTSSFRFAYLIWEIWLARLVREPWLKWAVNLRTIFPREICSVKWRVVTGIVAF